MRLIDADSLNAALDATVAGLKENGTETDKKWSEYTQAIVDCFHKCIDLCPTVKPKRKLGYWEEIEADDNFFSGRCSECHKYALQAIGWGGHMDLPYCPNCGAKMRGKKL